jgi:hypothetical protein
LGFWQRLAQLLQIVAELLPANVPVTWLADRAFGTPQFLDLLQPYGWHYVVRVQGQTRIQPRTRESLRVLEWPKAHHKRAKGRVRIFKKQGWREASVVVYHSPHHAQALCLVSDLPPAWALIDVYRGRYPIEATFRDYKTFGWHWEQVQVTNLQHIEHLLVAMALATWFSLLAGAQVAREWLQQPASGRRQTVPWIGKRSLFTLGLLRVRQALHSQRGRLVWQLSDWLAPNWQHQLYCYHARAFVFAPVRP